LSFIVVIPARYQSSRLPGKPLCDLGGRPMIQWVWERAQASGAAEVIIATDDERIRTCCRGFGADVEMTSTAHNSGTDRIAEVADKRRLADSAILVNVQGDEPMIPAPSIRALAQALHDHPACQIATPVTPVVSEAQWRDPNCVKAVRALDGTAMYFSRAPIPWPREPAAPGAASDATTFQRAWRHVGLYAYRASSLRDFAGWSPSALEETEKLEQLRALEHGMKIYLLPLSESPPGGVDTPEDLAALRESVASGFSRPL
jgi:3-deoxy-manno-octulosonate cytidylyltransferase (CMP-KDO synthetase)